MGEIKIKLPEDLPEEEKKRMMGGPFRESRRSGCMLILILPLILSLTMIFLISL